MFIPLRTDRPLRRRPRVTEAILIINLVVYLIGLMGPQFGWFEIEAFYAAGQFDPRDFSVLGLFTSQFLHDPYGLGHIAFNMLFLWVFGTSVEDRMGRLGYLSFYLIGGAVANLAHMMVSVAPVIGASGAISAVVGGFIALFPRARIKVLVIFFFIGIYQIPAMWIIGLYVLLDVLSQTAELLGGAHGGTAYMAHIAGYVYGFALSFTLLAIRICPRGEFDVFYLFKQSRRRAAFRAAAKRNMGGIWDAPARDTGELVAKHHKKTGPLSETDKQIAALRATIVKLISEHRLPDAAQRYCELLAIAPKAVLTEERQIDVANQLYADQHWPEAAVAYDRLLETYPATRDAAQMRLILAVLYTRRLNKPDLARKQLDRVEPALREDGERALAEALRAELKGASA